MTNMTVMDGMEALTAVLAGAPSEAGRGVEHLCKQSARKAVDEVLDVIFSGAQRRDGIIRLRYTEFSEPLIEQIVRRAIDGCCD